MANIIIDAREYRTTTGRYIVNLLDHLQAMDSSNDYIVLLKSEDIDFFKINNPRFTKQVCNYKSFSWGEQLGFCWMLYRLRGDLVHFGMTQQPLLYFGRCVTTHHDLTLLRYRVNVGIAGLIKSYVYGWLVKAVVLKNRFIFTPSKYSQEDLRAWTSAAEDKIIVTHLGADKIQEEPLPIPSLRGHDFLLYVGRADRHKNLSRLILAFKESLLKFPSLHLVLAGRSDSQYEALKVLCQDQGIGERVHFTGFVTESQLKWLYQNCRAYIFPSLSEGFGLPGLEAMTEGALVLSSEATCLKEIYGEHAIYFDPQSTESMVAAIDHGLSQAQLCERLKKSGPLHAASFSWKRMAETTLETYQRALVSHNPSVRSC